MTTNALPGPNVDYPEDSFTDPQVIVDCKELTRALKEHALNRWELSAHLRSDMQLLEKIAQARQRLAAQFSSVTGQPPKKRAPRSATEEPRGLIPNAESRAED
jgi:hypothetical protein